MGKETGNKKGLLKRVDNYLLTHRPVTWSSRIHAVLFYGLLFLLFLFAIAFIVPDDPRSNSEVYNWVILLSVVSLLAFIFWMIFLLRFNVFKRYGRWGKLDSLKTFLFYFLAILLFISWPYVPPVVQSIRANIAYTTPELTRDVNEMNTLLCQLERETIDLRFRADTFEVKEYVQGVTQRMVRDDVTGSATYSSGYSYIDSVNLKGKLDYADSSAWLNGSVCVVYECPDYMFVNGYNLQSSGKEKLLRSIDLYRSALKEKADINRTEALQNLNGLITKYSKGTSHGEYDYYDYEPEGYRKMINKKYRLYTVNPSVRHIADRKYRWGETAIGGAVRVAYYTTLVLALLVFIYRHSTRKPFFLSLLAGVLLLILTVLLLAFRVSAGDYAMGWYVFYFVGFAVVSASVFFKKSRGVFSGIALNLAFFMTPLLPLVIVGLYYQALHDRYDARVYYNDISYQSLFRNESLHYLLAEVGGFVLLLVLLALIVQKAYRRWYALPAH